MNNTTQLNVKGVTTVTVTLGDNCSNCTTYTCELCGSKTHSEHVYEFITHIGNIHFTTYGYSCDVCYKEQIAPYTLPERIN